MGPSLSYSGIIVVYDGSMFVDCTDNHYPLIHILINLVLAFVFRETVCHIRLVIYPQSNSTPIAYFLTINFVSIDL